MEGRDVVSPRPEIPKFSDLKNPKIPPRKLHEVKGTLHTQLKRLSNIPQTDTRKGTKIKKLSVPTDSSPFTSYSEPDLQRPLSDG